MSDGRNIDSVVDLPVCRQNISEDRSQVFLQLNRHNTPPHALVHLCESRQDSGALRPPPVDKASCGIAQPSQKPLGDIEGRIQVEGGLC